MGRLFILDYDEIQPSDCIFCRMCKVRVAFVEDYIGYKNDLIPEGIFTNMFNVQVPTGDQYQHERDGDTLTDTYCVQCGLLLGWKLIAVTQPCMFSKDGRFVMQLDNLCFWDDGLLYEQEPNDEDGGDEQVANEQDLGANDQITDQDGEDGDSTEQDLGANEQNADQDEGANEQVPNEQVPNEQYGGVNEPVPHQDEDMAEGMDQDEDIAEGMDQDEDIAEGMDNIGPAPNI